LIPGGTENEFDLFLAPHLKPPLRPWARRLNTDAAYIFVSIPKCLSLAT
jgi:hypothetical protein